MKLPDRIFGINTKEAYKKYLEESKKKPTSKKTKVKKRPTSALVEGVTLSDYIFLPSHNLYVAKETSHLNQNWTDSHTILHQEKARMLTLREHVDFLTLLQSGNAEDGLGNNIARQEVQTIYNEIIETRTPWRGEWLDAHFTNVGNSLHINYNHRTINGQLQPQHTETLETCVMTDNYVDITSFNKQGLPTQKSRKQDIYYWHPQTERVALFIASSNRARLNCNNYGNDTITALGVRVARELEETP